MKKVEVEVSDIALSGSSSGAYAMVLSEVEGNRKLPIVIGGAEAQAIAIEIEKMKASRPLTHDLFKSAFGSFGIRVLEVIIYNMVDIHLIRTEPESFWPFRLVAKRDTRCPNEKRLLL